MEKMLRDRISQYNLEEQKKGLLDAINNTRSRLDSMKVNGEYPPDDQIVSDLKLHLQSLEKQLREVKK